MNEPVVRARDRQRAMWFALVAAIAVGAFTTLYLFAVRTPRGQRWDDGALAGRVYESERIRDHSAELLSVISVSSLAALGSALILTALARRRPRLAIGVGVVVFGSIVLAEVLKAVLTRPLLVAEPQHWMRNTFPSGHSTIGMALGIGLVLVVPHRRRALAAVIGFAFGASIATGTLTAGWHRPSDALAAICLVTAVASTVCALLVSTRGGVGAEELPGTVHPALRLAIIVTVSAFPLAVLIGGLVARHRGFAWSTIGRRFLVASGAVVGASLLVTAGIALLLWRVTLDPPADHESPAIG